MKRKQELCHYALSNDTDDDSVIATQRRALSDALENALRLDTRVLPLSVSAHNTARSVVTMQRCVDSRMSLLAGDVVHLLKSFLPGQRVPGYLSPQCVSCALPDHTSLVPLHGSRHGVYSQVSVQTMALNFDGDFIVCSHGDGVLPRVFDRSDGHLITACSSDRFINFKTLWPAIASHHRTHRILVVDDLRCQSSGLALHTFDEATGAYTGQHSLPTEGVCNTWCNTPTAIDYNNDRLYVCDRINNGINVYTLSADCNGARRVSWSHSPLHMPTAMALDPCTGELVVSDYSAFGVLKALSLRDNSVRLIRTPLSCMCSNIAIDSGGLIALNVGSSAKTLLIDNQGRDIRKFHFRDDFDITPSALLIGYDADLLLVDGTSKQLYRTH